MREPSAAFINTLLARIKEKADSFDASEVRKGQLPGASLSRICRISRGASMPIDPDSHVLTVDLDDHGVTIEHFRHPKGIGVDTGPLGRR